ncbi:MAG: family 43 glycosylhydrolase [Lachnospiraceae bacterium]|nr:family 43 glycosylhydrolase [Lachnospiraceae bacterium]
MGYSLSDTEAIKELAKSYKISGETNSITTQAYGADPFAMVYGDTVYIYMTDDHYEYDAAGEISENTYSKINKIHVVSTKDMKNFTDHGCINVAGENGIAKWAKNSWAPAAAWKTIDGKDKFFLYFADNGGGIGVIEADSPVGPFRDPLGHGLIRRDMENCGNVLWLFDPAVFVDEDGTGYIYFGGGVPEGQAAHPLTGRCAQLGDDMISLATVPVVIDAPYLFEDSGIHKCGDTYYYSYCSNFSVDAEGTKQYGMTNGQICYMTSKSPLGPFTYAGMILENPEKICGLGGNNHHALFEFKGDWYIAYHSRMLEKNIGVKHGYRATNIDKVKYAEDGSIINITQTTAGPDMIGTVDPYTANSAVCVCQMAGTDAVPADEIGYGNMVLGQIDTGDYTEIIGVDFGDKGANTLCIKANVPAGTVGAVRLCLDTVDKDGVAAVVLYPSEENAEGVYKVALDKTITGKHNVYFVFSGSGYTVDSWCFA